MFKTKVFEIISTLSEKEFYNFELYITSPYFNRNKKIIELFYLFKDFYPNFDNIIFTREDIHKKIYPDKPFSDSKIRVLLSDLNSLAEHYIAQITYDSKNYERSFNLIEQLNKRKIIKRQEEVFNKLEAEIKQEEFNLDVLLYLMRLESEKFNFQITNKFLSTVKNIRSDIYCLLKRGEYLVYFVVLDILKSSDILFKYIRYNDEKIDNTLLIKFINNIDLKKTLDEISKMKSEYSEVLNLYFKQFMAFSEIDNHKHYEEFKNAVLNDPKIKGTEVKKYFIAKLIDYCITKNKYSIQRLYDIDLFEIYNVFVNEEMYLSHRNQYFYPDLFRNIIFHALRIKKYKWCHDFVEKYSPKLHPDLRKSMLNFSTSLINFYENKFDAAYNDLSKVKFDVFVFKYDIRNLSIMLNYELGYFDMVISQLDSYRHFIKYDKNTPEFKKRGVINFLKIVGGLINSVSVSDYEAGFIVAKMSKELDSMPEVQFRDWLKKKLNEVSKN